MRLDALFRALGVVNLERPPEPWEAETDEASFARLAEEIIATWTSRGARVQDLIVSLANVVVEPDSDPSHLVNGPPPGEFLALTVRGPKVGDTAGQWIPGEAPSAKPLHSLSQCLTRAGVRYAYVPTSGSASTITVFLSRRREAPPTAADTGSRGSTSR